MKNSYQDLSTEARRIVVDRLGELCDSMHTTARVQKTHQHGNWEATREAADFISDLRKEVR